MTWTIAMVLACSGDDHGKGPAGDGPHGQDPSITDPTGTTPTDTVPTGSSASCAGPIVVDGGSSYDSLQDALDAASTDSELALCPGTYTGAFVASVPVRISAVEDATTTILTGAGGTVLTVPGGTEIVGLTVTGGKSSGAGGGIALSDAGTLRLESCVVTDNHAHDGGGLSVAPGGTATLVDTELRDNVAVDGGGGVWVGSGATLDLSDGSVVVGNIAGSWGGGVWLDAAHLVGGVVRGNTVTEPAYIDYGNGQIHLDVPAWGGEGVAMGGGSDVTGSEITGQSGMTGAVSIASGVGTLIDVSVHDNEGYLGGGLDVLGGTADLQGTTSFTGNAGSLGGGGLVLVGDVLGGTFEDNTADGGGGLVVYTGNVEGTTFRGNQSPNGGGGIYTAGLVTVSDSVFEDNRAYQGGAIASESDPGDRLEVTGGRFEGNQAVGEGGAVYAMFDLAITDADFSDNSAGAGGGAVWIYGDSTISGGSMLRNVAAEGGAVYVTYNDKKGGPSLSASAVDLGEAADDNAPDDVAVGSTNSYTYGADATFDCTTSCQ